PVHSRMGRDAGHEDLRARPDPVDRARGVSRSPLKTPFFGRYPHGHSTPSLDGVTDLEPDEFRRLGHAVVDWVAAYRTGLPDRPVRPEVVPGQVRAGLPDLVPEHPQPLHTLLDAVDRVIAPATLAWQHPGFYGYFPANAALASLLGDLLSGGLG